MLKAFINYEFIYRHSEFYLEAWINYTKKLEETTRASHQQLMDLITSNLDNELGGVHNR